MTRYITKKEMHRVFDRSLIDIMAHRYEEAHQRYSSVVDTLRERAGSPGCYTRNFRPEYLVTGFGLGFTEGLIAKPTSPKPKDISDIAKDAQVFYNTFSALKNLGWSDEAFEAYRTLGKSYVEIGRENEGFQMLEQLKRPRIVDFIMLRKKAMDFSGE